MNDETPLRIDLPRDSFDDHARQALDGILGAGLDEGIGAALDEPTGQPLAIQVPSGVASLNGTSTAAERHDPPAPRDEQPDDEDDLDADDEDVTGRLIRPYAMTGGRTGGDGPDIPLEAQVLASSQAAEYHGSYRWEAARLLEMVETPMALVEIAARLEVPVGVARVLVGDLVEDGSLIIHLPPPTSSFTSLLEQVLDGVRDL